jgi:3-methyl-2-oxobutanoate hydroxymethyltransferase
MSHVSRTRGMTVAAFRRRKSSGGGEPLVCLTAYTTPMARLLDPACDLLLVGDSLGMVVYGLPSTVPVTLEMMIAHGGAVVRGAAKSLVIVDLPFGSYQESPAQAFRSSARVMAETGCAGVKLEGGEAMAETIAFLVGRGVPVLGHVGLQPQSVHAYGGYGARGKAEPEAERIVADARAVADAGAFAMVVEGVVEPLARRITDAVPVPTIGIGASAACDGQILVCDDVLGLFGDFRPKFVKQYADLAGTVQAAARAYAEDVRARRFPGPEQVYGAGPAPGASEPL